MSTSAPSERFGHYLTICGESVPCRVRDAAIPASATEQLLTRYKSYLTAERGLAATTAELNVRLVRPLLFEHAGEQESRIELKELTARDIAAFVVEQSAQRPRSINARRNRTCVRSWASLHRGVDRPAAGKGGPLAARLDSHGPAQSVVGEPGLCVARLLRC